MLQKSQQISAARNLEQFVHAAGYKSPTLLQRSVLPQILQNRDVIVEAGPGEGRTGLFLISLLMQFAGNPASRSLILTASENEVRKILRQYKRFSSKTYKKPHLAGLGLEEGVRKDLKLLSKRPEIVVGTTERVIDHLRRENFSVEGVSQLILVAPDEHSHSGFEKDVQFIYSKLTGKCQTQLYTPEMAKVTYLQTALRRPIAIKKCEWEQAPEQQTEKPTEETQEVDSATKRAFEDYIKTTLKKIREDENPSELNELRKVFRRHTPLHLRAYFAAYLLKNAGADKRTSNGKFKTLFVSIGKNRKVFPKDLNRLFTQELGLGSDDLGNIKILDNYSFVDIAASKAQPAIDKLDNLEFRGRKISVNFARKRN